MRDRFNKILRTPYAEYFLFLLAVIPVFIFRDFTPNNELKYLSIANEAIQNKTLFAFTNHGIAYADKPPMYLWIIMLGKILLGKHSMLFIGMFSVLPALAIIRLMDQWLAGHIRAGIRGAGRVMLFTCAYFIGTAVVLRMDMLMCLFIILSLRTFMKIYEGDRSNKNKLLFPVYIFLAVFTKGPVGILVPLLSTIVFLAVNKKLRQIGIYWNLITIGILLLLFTVWFSCVYLEGGKEYFNNLLFNQTINRAVDSFHHKHPFWYYLQTIWYIIAPWSLLIIGLFVTGLVHRIFRSPTEKFFLTIFTVTFIMLSVVSAKLEVYILPAIPFIVYLILPLLETDKYKTIKIISLSIPAAVLVLAFPVFFTFDSEMSGLRNVFVKIAACILTVAGVISFVLLLKSNFTGVIKTIGYGFLAAVFISSFSLKDIRHSTGFGAMAKSAKEYAEHNRIRNYYFYDIRSAENMDVYLGADVIGVGRENEVPFEKIERPALIFIRNKDLLSVEWFNGSHCKLIANYGSYCYAEIK